MGYKLVHLLLILALVGGTGAFFLGNDSYAAGPSGVKDMGTSPQAQPAVQGLSPFANQADANTPQVTTIRVAPSGSNDPACGTVDLPCQTIQYAVNKAASGDTILGAQRFPIRPLAAPHFRRSTLEGCA